MSLLTLGYVLQIALFGGAGTMFIRAHLANRELARLNAALPPSERYRDFSAAGKSVPVTRERAEALRRVGRFLLFGFIFLATAVALSALIATTRTLP